MSQQKKQPEKKIGPFPNGIGVAIWVNDVDTPNGAKSFRSITLAPRRYFDRQTNQWKDAPSYQPGDLPALIHALQVALGYCFEVPLPEGATESGLPADIAPPVEGDVPF